jgi:hypothetical protein
MRRTQATPRKYNRFKVDLPARFRLVGKFRWRQGALLNLSKGGVCLLSRGIDGALVINDELEIEVATIDGEGRIQVRRLKSKVMWRRGNRYGLEFKKPARRPV